MDGNIPENTPIVTPEMEKKQPPKSLITVLAVVIIVIVCAGFLFAQRACSEQHHSQYATGQTYTISGYVEKATKEVHRNGTDRTKKHTVYKVRIKTTEDLPNGERVFESTDFEDYSKVSRYAEMPNALLDLTIDEKGYIAKAEESPENTGDDIDWNDPEDIENFENLSDEEQSEKLFNLWKEKKRQGIIDNAVSRSRSNTRIITRQLLGTRYVSKPI